MFFFAATIWISFSSTRMLLLAFFSIALIIFSFSKMERIKDRRQIACDIFPSLTWILAIIAANAYVEVAHSASGLEAVRYMGEWKIIGLFIAVIIINKLFNLFCKKGDQYR